MLNLAQGGEQLTVHLSLLVPWPPHLPKPAALLPVHLHHLMPMRLLRQPVLL